MTDVEFLCPACGGKRTCDAATPSIHHQLFRCTTCMHVFVPAATFKADRNRQVQLEYFGESFAAREGFFVAFYERINAGRTARALGRVTGKRLLEIGPGSGAVMARLGRLGSEVQGLDMSPAVARQIERRWGLQVTVGTLAEHVRTVGQKTYDMVVMRHVLEHFTDPYEALKDMHALLKPGGRLYVAVPNMGSWHSRFRGWPGYEPYHVQYFGKQSLAVLLRRSGFQPVRMASYESLTGWTNTVLRSLTKRESTGGDAGQFRDNWKRQTLEIARLMAGWVLSPFRWVQSVLGRGEELVVVAEKVA